MQMHFVEDLLHVVHGTYRLHTVEHSTVVRALTRIISAFIICPTFVGAFCCTTRSNRPVDLKTRATSNLVGFSAPRTQNESCVEVKVHRHHGSVMSHGSHGDSDSDSDSDNSPRKERIFRKNLPPGGAGRARHPLTVGNRAICHDWGRRGEYVCAHRSRVCLSVRRVDSCGHRVLPSEFLGSSAS